MVNKDFMTCLWMNFSKYIIDHKIAKFDYFTKRIMHLKSPDHVCFLGYLELVKN